MSTLRESVEDGIREWASHLKYPDIAVSDLATDILAELGKRTCSTCASWRTPFHLSGEYGLCQRIPDGASPTPVGCLAHLSEVTGNGADFNTRGDFGCALWNAKP